MSYKIRRRDLYLLHFVLIVLMSVRHDFLVSGCWMHSFRYFWVHDHGEWYAGPFSDFPFLSLHWQSVFFSDALHRLKEAGAWQDWMYPTVWLSRAHKGLCMCLFVVEFESYEGATLMM